MANPNGQRTDLRAAQQLLVPIASLGASSPPLPPLLGAGNGVVALDSSSERWSDGSDFSLSSVSSTAPSVISFSSSMPHTVPQSPAMSSFDDHSQSTIRAADQTLPSDQTFSLLRYLTHIAPANRSSRSGSMGAAFASEAPAPQQQSELAEPSTVIAVTPFVPPASLTQSRESSPVLAAPAPALHSQSSAAVNVDQLSEDLMAFSMKEAPTSSLLSTPTASPSNHHLYHSGKPLLDSQPNLDQEEPSTAPSQSSAERAQGNTYQWLNAARYQGNPFFGVGGYTADFAGVDTYPAFSDSPSSASASFATAPVAATPLTIDLSPPPPPHQTQSQSSHSTIIMPDTVPSLTSGSGTDSDDSSADLPSLANTIVPVFPYGSGHHQQLSATSSLSQIPEDDYIAKSGEAIPLYGVGMPSYLPVYNADTMMAPPLMPPTKVEPFDEYVEEKSEIILPVGLPSNSSVVEAPPSPSGLSDDDGTHELHREVFFGESSVTSSPQQHHLALGSPSPSQSTDSFVVHQAQVRPAPIALGYPHPPPPPRPSMELCSLFMGPTEESMTRPPSFEASSPSQSTAQQQQPQQQQEQEHRDANADRGYYDPYQRIREQLLLRQNCHAVPSSTSKPLYPAFWGASAEAAPAPAPAQQPSSILVPLHARDDPQLALRAAQGFTVPWRNAPAPAPVPSARRRQSICRYGLYEDSSSESSVGGGDDDEGLYQPYVVSGKGKTAVREKVEEKDDVEDEQVEPYFVDESKGKGKETVLESEESFPSKSKQEEREVEFVHAKDIGMDEVTKKPSLTWDPRTWVYSPVQHGGESESMVDSVLDTAERKASNPTSVRTLDQWVSEVTLYQAKIPSFRDANVKGPEPSMEGSWSTAWFEATRPKPPQQASASGFVEMRSPTLTSVVTFAPSAPSSPATTTPTCSSPVSPLPPCRQSRSRSRSTTPSPSSSRQPSPSNSPLPTVSFKLPHEDNDGANREAKPRSTHSVAPSTYPVTPLAPLGDCLNFTADGIRPRPTKANSFGHAPGGSYDYTTRRWNGAPPSVPAFDPAQINNNNIGYNMSTPAWYTGTTPAQAWQTPQTPWMNSNQFPKVSPPTGLGYGYGLSGGAGCLPPPVAPIMGPNLTLPPSTSSLPARTTTLPYYSAGIPTYPLPPAQTGPLGTGPFVHTPYILPQVSPPQVQQPTQPPFATPGIGMGPAPVPPLSTFPQVPRWGTTLHTRFCFPDANIAFLVQNVEYRVHRYFLEQHSTFFKELLAPYPAHYTEPITLVTNVRDFDRLLSFFYPADLSEPEIKSVEEWTSILSVATNWSFTQLRKRAINMLSTKANAVQRIAIARRYNVKELAYAGYEELCMRSQPVPLQDAEELGLKTVLKIWEAQQDLMKVGFCRMHCCKTYVEHTIKKKFDLE